MFAVSSSLSHAAAGDADHVGDPDHDVPPIDAAWAYRRRARQLRGRLSRDPVALHLSLKQLAADTDAAARLTRPHRPVRHRIPRARHVQSQVVHENRAAATNAAFADDTLAASLNVPAAAVDRFADQVRTMLQEGILRYDQRRSLFQSASTLGLGRFEASLVIAAVEHRHRSASPAHVPADRPSKPIAGIVAAVLLLELTVVGIGWMFFV